MANTATFRNPHDLHIIPVEDLWQHVARLLHDYIHEGKQWVQHRDDDRVDACFVTYQKALDVLKSRVDLDPVSVQDRLLEIRSQFA